jgi:putative mRNA 3-end processing factor
MLIRGTRRRRGADRGFALSDHADWPGLIAAVRATGASRVLVTHGASAPLVRWLNENGWQAEPLPMEAEKSAGSHLVHGARLDQRARVRTGSDPP